MVAYIMVSCVEWPGSSRDRRSCSPYYWSYPSLIDLIPLPPPGGSGLWYVSPPEWELSGSESWANPTISRRPRRGQGRRSGGANLSRIRTGRWVDGLRTPRLPLHARPEERRPRALPNPHDGV